VGHHDADRGALTVPREGERFDLGIVHVAASVRLGGDPSGGL
jgi:hypothetical protein